MIMVQVGTLADTVQAVTALSGLPSSPCFGFPAQAAFTNNPCIQQRLQDCTVQLLTKIGSSKAWLDHLKLASTDQPLLSPTAAESLLNAHACTEAAPSQLMLPSAAAASAQAAVGQQTAAPDGPTRAHLGTDDAEGQPTVKSSRAPGPQLCPKAATWLTAGAKSPATSSTDTRNGAQNSIALALEALLRIKDASQPRSRDPLKATTAVVQTGPTQAPTASRPADMFNAHQDGAWQPEVAFKQQAVANRPSLLANSGKTADALGRAAQLATAATCQDGAAGSPKVASSDEHPDAGSKAAQLAYASKQRNRASQAAHIADADKHVHRAHTSAKPADAIPLPPQDSLHQPAQLANSDVLPDTAGQPAHHPPTEGVHEHVESLSAQLPICANQRKPSSLAEAELEAECQNDAALACLPSENPVDLLLQSLSQLQAITLKAVHAAGCCHAEPPSQLDSHSTQGSADLQAEADSNAGAHPKAEAEAQAQAEPPAHSDAQARSGSLAMAHAEAGSKPIPQARSASQSSVQRSRLGDLSKLEPSLNIASRTRLQQLKEEASHAPRRRSVGDSASVSCTQQRRRSCQPACSSGQPAGSSHAGQKRKHSMSSSTGAARRKSDEVSWAGPNADTGHIQAVRRCGKLTLCKQYADCLLCRSWHCMLIGGESVHGKASQRLVAAGYCRAC